MTAGAYVGRLGRLGRPSPGRVALLAALAAVGGLLVLIFIANPGLVANDANTYLAAGERLNAGHLLYALSPGDRQVPVLPPFWTAPLLSPPFIAVLWRPLALLPEVLPVACWTVASFIAVAASLALVLGRRDVIAAVIVAILARGLALVAVTGNLDAFLMLASIAIWRLGRRDHEGAVGALVALTIAFKITTLGFAWMLVVERRWAALRSMVLVGAAAALVSVLGAGLPAHFDWLAIARRTTVAGATPTSLTGIAGTLGVPPDVATLLPVAAFALCITAMVVFRRRRSVVFVLALVSGVFDSPVVNSTNLARLISVLAPVASPDPDSGPKALSATAASEANRIG